ncbi:MAG: class I SAM-dependent DNA methyltransferase [Thermodesulfobacteriota bacterium]
MTTQLECTLDIPKIDNICQGQEIFAIEKDGKREEIRVHEYDKIYNVPGLYEHLFYDKLKCQSPKMVCSLLEQQLNGQLSGNGKISVLDLGAGNGMVGEELKKIGADEVIGIDIIEEAATATERDRPGVYEKYYIADLTNLDDAVERDLANSGLNCLTIVAALGFEDIPPEAFATGYNFVESSGLIAFNIKESFVNDGDETGFSRLITKMIDSDVMDLKTKERYCHRYCLDGRPLYYYAMVGEKNADITQDLLAEIGC